MPCGDDGYSEFCEKREKEELIQNLCYLCANLLEDELLDKYASGRILEWHKAHMKSDERKVSLQIRYFYTKNISFIVHPQKVANHFIKLDEEKHPVSNWHKKWFYDLAVQVANNIIEERKLQRNM